jgi:hypothetical protein
MGDSVKYVPSVDATRSNSFFIHQIYTLCFSPCCITTESRRKRARWRGPRYFTGGCNRGPWRRRRAKCSERWRAMVPRGCEKRARGFSVHAVAKGEG